MNWRFLGGLAVLGGAAAYLAWTAATPSRHTVSSHHPGGTNLSVHPLADGRPDGNWVTWYEDRWKESEATYALGARVGTWRLYGRPERQPDGKAGQVVLREANFSKDALEGRFTRRFADGEVREQGNYRVGLRHGPFVTRDTPDAEPVTHVWWCGHDLGGGPAAAMLFDDLERNPPADAAALDARLKVLSDR